MRSLVLNFGLRGFNNKFVWIPERLEKDGGPKYPCEESFELSQNHLGDEYWKYIDPILLTRLQYSTNEHRSVERHVDDGQNSQQPVIQESRLSVTYLGVKLVAAYLAIISAECYAKISPQRVVQ